MTTRVSTGLRNYMAASGSVKAALTGGYINIYSGAAPSSADAAATGTLLCVVSVDDTGAGLNLADTAADGVLGKASEVWSGTNLESGTAGYFRFVESGDDGSSSSSALRLQGDCGVAGKELNLSSVNLTANAVQSIDAGNIVFPTL